ncbi:8712_t:CDS:2, partial [Funneliformis caledonium]
MNSIYVVLWILIIQVNCQNKTLPLQRKHHTATFINNKLYILGGNVIFAEEDKKFVGKGFFSLDFSTKFKTTQELSWNDMTNDNIVPAHSGATTVKGVDDKTLILYGGSHFKSERMSLIYNYDTIDNRWNELNESYPHRSGITAINCDSIMYLFGGFSKKERTVNEMLYLNLQTLQWGIASSINGPDPRMDYGAVLLLDKNIMYLGGRRGPKSSSLSQVFLYNTTSDKWISRGTSGSIPSNRYGFSAVL